MWSEIKKEILRTSKPTKKIKKIFYSATSLPLAIAVLKPIILTFYLVLEAIKFILLTITSMTGPRSCPRR